MSTPSFPHRAYRRRNRRVGGPVRADAGSFAASTDEVATRSKAVAASETIETLGREVAAPAVASLGNHAPLARAVPATSAVEVARRASAVEAAPAATPVEVEPTVETLAQLGIHHIWRLLTRHEHAASVALDDGAPGHASAAAGHRSRCSVTPHSWRDRLQALGYSALAAMALVAIAHVHGGSAGGMRIPSACSPGGGSATACSASYGAARARSSGCATVCARWTELPPSRMDTSCAPPQTELAASRVDTSCAAPWTELPPSRMDTSCAPPRTELAPSRVDTSCAPPRTELAPPCADAEGCVARTRSAPVPRGRAPVAGERAPRAGERARCAGVGARPGRVRTARRSTMSCR